MKKILMVLSLLNCIESQGMNIAEILNNLEPGLNTNIFEVQKQKDSNRKIPFAKVISMEQLFHLILQVPQLEFYYSVMVNHIIPPPVGESAVFESISDTLPPLSILDKEGCQWQPTIPGIEDTMLVWKSMLMDVRHEQYHIPLLKMIINDFLNERDGNTFTNSNIDVKLRNIMDLFEHKPTLYSMKNRAIHCNSLVQFESILDKINSERIRAEQQHQHSSAASTDSKLSIAEKEARVIFRDLYSIMHLDQVETENIEGFYIPTSVIKWSKAERVVHWNNWINHFSKKGDIAELLNNKNANPDEVARKYYIPILQALNIEINWARNRELMPILMNVLNSYYEFVDFINFIAKTDSITKLRLMLNCQTIFLYLLKI